MLQENLRINKQATKVFSFALVDEDGAVVDITNGTILMTVKEKRKHGTAEAIFSQVGVIVSATAGTFTVTVDPTDTNANPGTYFYDVVVTISTARYTAARGRFTIDYNITIPTS